MVRPPAQRLSVEAQNALKKKTMDPKKQQRYAWADKVKLSQELF